MISLALADWDTGCSLQSGWRSGVICSPQRISDSRKSARSMLTTKDTNHTKRKPCAQLSCDSCVSWFTLLQSLARLALSQNRRYNFLQHDRAMVALFAAPKLTNQRMHAESSSVSWAVVAQPLGPGDPGRSSDQELRGRCFSWSVSWADMIHFFDQPGSR